jgi:hypothetical protein
MNLRSRLWKTPQSRRQSQLMLQLMQLPPVRARQRRSLPRQRRRSRLSSRSGDRLVVPTGVPIGPAVHNASNPHKLLTLEQ